VKKRKLDDVSDAPPEAQSHPGANVEARARASKYLHPLSPDQILQLLLDM
jgi:hypothetical protein